MKSPGSKLVHYVDTSGRCHPALVRAWHEDGRYDLTVFTTAGSISAARGVTYEPIHESMPHKARSWHNDCPETN